MGFSEDMRASIKYTNSLKRKKNLFDHKVFAPKPNPNNVSLDNNKTIFKNKTDNRFYSEQLKADNIRGVIAGGISAVIILYYFFKIVFF